MYYKFTLNNIYTQEVRHLSFSQPNCLQHFSYRKELRTNSFVITELQKLTAFINLMLQRLLLAFVSLKLTWSHN